MFHATRRTGGVAHKVRLGENMPYIVPILRDEINMPYIFQYLGSLEAIYVVLIGLTGELKCSTSRQPTSKPIFDRKMD